MIEIIGYILLILFVLIVGIRLYFLNELEKHMKEFMINYEQSRTIDPTGE